MAAHVALYRSLSQDEPEVMLDSARRYLQTGYRRLQVKVGGDPLVDAEVLAAVVQEVGPDITLFCDANGAWTSFDALRFVEATREYDYVLEQPCASYGENLIVRRACGKPIVLDESVDSLDALLKIQSDGAADGVTLKISHFGGITRTRRIRDLAVAFDLMVTVEDTGGSQIDTAAIAHLCLSTPEERRCHHRRLPQLVHGLQCGRYAGDRERPDGAATRTRPGRGAEKGDLRSAAA